MIAIPGYRRMIQGAMQAVQRARDAGRRPIAEMPPNRFAELMEYARAKIQAAEEIEQRALHDPIMFELYEYRLRDAYRAILGTYDEPRAQAGERQSRTQRGRREGKPGTDSQDDPDRNDRIRRAHDRLKAAGHRNATAQVAQEFDLSPSQVRRITRKRA